MSFLFSRGIPIPFLSMLKPIYVYCHSFTLSRCFSLRFFSLFLYFSLSLSLSLSIYLSVCLSIFVCVCVAFFVFLSSLWKTKQTKNKREARGDKWCLLVKLFWNRTRKEWWWVRYGPKDLSLLFENYCWSVELNLLPLTGVKLDVYYLFFLFKRNWYMIEHGFHSMSTLRSELVSYLFVDVLAAIILDLGRRVRYLSVALLKMKAICLPSTRNLIILRKKMKEMHWNVPPSGFSTSLALNFTSIWFFKIRFLYTLAWEVIEKAGFY